MEVSWSFFAATILASSAPLVVASLGETYSERAGVINLSLDGTIILGAMVGFVTAYKSGNAFLGILGAGFAGAIVAAIIGVFSVLWKIPQVAVGFILTLTCRDLAYFLGNNYTRIRGPQLETLPLPFLAKIPAVGDVLFSHNLMTYISFILIPLSWFYFFRTKYGLLLRAVGENPVACYARGYKVRRIQFFYVVFGGFLVGVSGAMYSLGVKLGWGRPQGAEGIGWIALALVIFGGWHPVKVAFGAYLFGFLQALGIILQNKWIGIPAQLLQVAPFPLMILTLVLVNRPTRKEFRPAFINKFFSLFYSRPPDALGKMFSIE